MTNKDQNAYISTYMKHKNIFQNRLKSYSEKIHFFSDQTLDIYKFLNTMIFLSVNHNLLCTILGTYPPGPFRKTFVLFAQKSSLYLYYLGWKFVHFFVFREK